MSHVAFVTLVVPVLAKLNVDNKGDVDVLSFEVAEFEALALCEDVFEDNLDKSQILQLPSREEVSIRTRGSLPNEIETDVIGSV